VLRRAYDERDFPVTVVRPSHTYDDAHPPLPGDWTAWDRIVRGDELGRARRWHQPVDHDARAGPRGRPRRPGRELAGDWGGLPHHLRRGAQLERDLRHHRTRGRTPGPASAPAVGVPADRGP